MTVRQPGWKFKTGYSGSWKGLHRCKQSSDAGALPVLVDARVFGRTGTDEWFQKLMPRWCLTE
jgi:hypothetical protein